MKFALIGAAGYIAPRHMKAINETGNELVAAVDPNDSVGVIDSYAPDCHFFTDFERFDEFLNSPEGKGVQYLSICSPNYLHEAHIKYGLRRGMTVICEKPLVLNSAALKRLMDVEKETNGKVFSILQLRHHAAIVDLKEKINADTGATFEVDLTYITSRGRWYLESWKGDTEKSGGVVMNIGVHFFDMLTYLFGEIRSHELHQRDSQTAAGFIQCERANIRWFLSVDTGYIPESVASAGQRTYRSITIGGEELEFSAGFTELHTVSYESVLQGNGFGLRVVKPSLELVEDIGTCATVAPTSQSRKHGFVK